MKLAELDAWRRALDDVVKRAAGLPSHETVGSLLGAAVFLAAKDGKTVDDVVQVLRVPPGAAN